MSALDIVDNMNRFIAAGLISFELIQIPSEVSTKTIDSLYSRRGASPSLALSFIKCPSDKILLTISQLY